MPPVQASGLYCPRQPSNCLLKLSPRMQAASTYHCKMFAITQAMQKWQQYLLGKKFLIVTNQQPLNALTKQVIQTPEQQQWLCKLIGYDFDIIYQPGKSTADALSRIPTSQFLSLTLSEFALLDKLQALNKSDPMLLELQHEADSYSLPQFSFHEGLFVQKYIRLHGFPSKIVTDCDPIFLFDLWKEINRVQGTYLAKNSAYHPQIDGQTEALNKCLEMYLRCFTADTPAAW